MCLHAHVCIKYLRQIFEVCIKYLRQIFDVCIKYLRQIFDVCIKYLRQIFEVSLEQIIFWANILSSGGVLEWGYHKLNHFFLHHVKLLNIYKEQLYRKWWYCFNATRKKTLKSISSRLLHDFVLFMVKTTFSEKLANGQFCYIFLGFHS